MKDKTRVLVTHSIDFLHLADKLVIMKQGHIVSQGCYDELQGDPYLQEILDVHSKQLDEYKATREAAIDQQLLDKEPEVSV